MMETVSFETDAALAIALSRAGWVAIGGGASTWMVMLINVVGKQSNKEAAAPVRENVLSGQGMLESAPPGQYRAAGQEEHSWA
jgi:hypothetical protein